MNKHKRTDIESQVYRKKVGERIKSEREHFFLYCDEGKEKEIKSKRIRKRNYDGLSLPEFGKETVIDEDTLYNLETGRAELKVEYLYRISEACGCDISYLLGECETRMFENNDICEATGLSEEAVMVLIEANKRLALDKRIWNEDIYSKEELEEIKKNNDEERRTFIDLINRIIESRGFDYSDDFMDFVDENSLSYVLVNTVLSQKAEGCFPINQLVEYVIKVRRANSYKSHRGYLDFIKVFRNNSSYFSYNPDIESICEQLKERGYTREEIESAKDVFKGFKFDDYEFEKKNKRYLRIDIQDSFSEFLRSDFVEGESNGE